MKNYKLLLTIALLCTLTLIVGCSNQETTLDRFTIEKYGDTVTVWLDEGDMIERNREPYITASTGMQIQLSLQGNYRIVSKNVKQLLTLKTTDDILNSEIEKLEDEKMWVIAKKDYFNSRNGKQMLKEGKQYQVIKSHKDLYTIRLDNGSPFPLKKELFD